MTDTFHNQKKKHFTLFSKKESLSVPFAIRLIGWNILVFNFPWICMMLPPLGFEEKRQIRILFPPSCFGENENGSSYSHGIWPLSDFSERCPKYRFSFTSMRRGPMRFMTIVLDYVNINYSKKNGDEDRTAASSHLPNIKCKRKLLQKNQCPAPARDVHNHEPWQSVSALLFSLLFLFYLVLRITCLTFMLRSKSFNVCSVVHNFECRTNGKRNGRKSEIIENVDAYSCVDFVTSANIHTQDLFVLINKFQRFGFMQARSALVRVRLP